MEVLFFGTIPANTGKMQWMHPFALCDGDHPREYGENDDAGIGGLTALGPSPRIRGKCEVHQVPRQLVGTIPANTGKISFSAAADTPPRDHPREYGENIASEPAEMGKVGPSPRIRGESCVDCVPALPPGTIPANTGRMVPT